MQLDLDRNNWKRVMRALDGAISYHEAEIAVWGYFKLQTKDTFPQHSKESMDRARKRAARAEREIAFFKGIKRDIEVRMKLARKK